jgi:antitoxin ParD1/3/4
MNVSLTPELEEFVSRKVESGMYSSASEVVRESLRLLREQDLLKQIRLEELRKEIALGLEASARGEFKTYDAESLKDMFEDIKKEGRKRLAEQQAKDAL